MRLENGVVKVAPQYLAADALGAWIAANLLGHLPTTDDEGKLAHVVGAFVVHAFFDWWDVS